MKRLKEEEEEWAKANEQRKIDGKEEQTLEDWRKEKKGVVWCGVCSVFVYVCVCV